MAFGDFTVTRASEKRVLGSSGTLVTYANNFPAFEYNADGTYRGLSVEPGATNLALYSQEFDNVAWTKANSGVGLVPVVTANQGTAPDGTNTADRVDFDCTDAGSSANRSRLQITATVVSGTVYVGSVYVKAFSPSDIGKTIRVSVETTGGLQQNVTLTDAYQRIEVGKTASPSTSLNFIFETRGTFTTQTASVLLWGAQLETGSVATSYIPTTGSTANRAADDISLSSASSLIGQTEGSVMIEAEVQALLGTTVRTFIEVSDGSNLNRFFVNFTSAASNTIRAGVVADNVIQSDFRQLVSVAGLFKFAYGYKSTDSAFYYNGLATTEISDNAFTFTSPLTKINIGSGQAGTQQPIAWIRSVALFPTRLSNAQLQALTA